jgi:hypothetical protein
MRTKVKYWSKSRRRKIFKDIVDFRPWICSLWYLNRIISSAQTPKSVFSQIDQRIHYVMHLVSVHDRRENPRCERPERIRQFLRDRAKSLMGAGIEALPFPHWDVERGAGKPARATLLDAFARPSARKLPVERPPHYWRVTTPFRVRTS